MEKIEGELIRKILDADLAVWLEFPDTSIDFCWDDFRKFCPNLTKGLCKGQSRKVILTQTQKGIKLERK